MQKSCLWRNKPDSFLLLFCSVSPSSRRGWARLVGGISDCQQEKKQEHVRERSRTCERQEESFVTPMRCGEAALACPVAGGRWGAAAGGWLRLRGWGKERSACLWRGPLGGGIPGVQESPPPLPVPCRVLDFTSPGKVARGSASAEPTWGFTAGQNPGLVGSPGFVKKQIPEGKVASVHFATSEGALRSQVWFWEKPSDNLRCNNRFPWSEETC